MTHKTCAYCGTQAGKKDKEHVFPKCLYPKSKLQPGIQLLTVPACRACNKSWSKDEVHFRNILVSAGENPNAPRHELWGTTVNRSFDEIDGIKQLQDLIAPMVPVEVDGRLRHMVFPGTNERVMRVVRKVIRGLCHYHKVMSPVADQQVWADVLQDEIPPEYFNSMNYHHREADIAEYRYQVLNENIIHSVWLITFFEMVTFIGAVAPNQKGFFR